MAKDSRQFTAFTVPGRGLCQWKVMPFGLYSASATFQRALDSVIGADMEPFAFAYLDDIIVIGATEEQHLANLGEVFRRLRRANLKVNPKKCAFFKRRLVYLGHVISTEGVQTDPEKVTAITNQQQMAEVDTPCKWIQGMRVKIKEYPEKFSDYMMENGQLYRNLGHRADDEDYFPWKLCASSSNRVRVLQERHDAPTAGHLAIRKTVSRLSQR